MLMLLKSNSNKQYDKASNKLLSASEGEGAMPRINIDFFTVLVCADIM